MLRAWSSSEALAAYDRALKAYPERFNSLLGAAHAALASGDRDRARTTLDHLLAMAKDGPRRQQAEALGRRESGSEKRSSGSP